MIQWLRLGLPAQGVWAQSLVGGLRSHIPCSQRIKRKTTHRRNIVTKLIKTSKMGHILKKILKSHWCQTLTSSSFSLPSVAADRFSSSLRLADLTDGGSAILRCICPQMRLSSSRQRWWAQPRRVPVYHLSLVFHHEKSELVTWANLPPKARTSLSRSRREATCRNIYNTYPDAGKDRRQKEKRATEDEMVGYHHQRTWVWADSEG